MKQNIEIGGRECLLYKKGEEPQVLLIQTLGAQERGSIDSEVAMISEASGTSFVMAAFAIGDWEVELTPWHDPAVSKRQAVGEHAGETLRYVTDTLIPYLHQEYGEIPIVLGGYSLGDREEHTRDKAIAQVGNNIRWEYEHLKQTLGPDSTTLEWNPGNHFVDGARRTAKGFSWCIDKVCQR